MRLPITMPVNSTHSDTETKSYCRVTIFRGKCTTLVILYVDRGRGREAVLLECVLIVPEDSQVWDIKYLQVSSISKKWSEHTVQQDTLVTASIACLNLILPSCEIQQYNLFALATEKEQKRYFIVGPHLAAGESLHENGDGPQWHLHLLIRHILD